MRLRDFQRVLEPILRMDKSQIETRVRRLRESGLLPSGGRGRNAPHITGRHAAMVLIAIASAEYSTDALRSVQLVGRAEPVKIYDDGTIVKLAQPYIGAQTLLELMTYLILDGRNINEMVSLLILPKCGMARLTLGVNTVDQYVNVKEVNGELRTSIEGAVQILSQPAWEFSGNFFREVAKHFVEYGPHQMVRGTGFWAEMEKATEQKVWLDPKD